MEKNMKNFNFLIYIFLIILLSNFSSRAIVNLNGTTTQKTKITGVDITGLTAGIFSASIADTNSYSANGSVADPEPPQVSESHTNNLCFGGIDGSIEISVTGGITPYTYLWNTGATSQNLYNLPAGIYSLTVTDGSGTGDTGGTFNWDYHTSVSPHIIIVPDGIISLNGQPVNTGDIIGVFYNSPGVGLLCGGYTIWPGYVTAIAAWPDDPGTTEKDGFANGESFNWKIWLNSSGIEVGMTATYMTGFPDLGSFTTNGTSGLALLTGTYSPPVPGQEGYATVTITEPDELLLSIETTNISTFGGYDGAADLTVTGGISPYMYDWSNGSTDGNLFNLSAGLYSVTVTDYNGCTATAETSVNQPGQGLSAYASVTNVSCEGGDDGIVDITAVGGTPPFTYLWNTGAATEDLNNLATGLYSVTITDSSGVTGGQPFTWHYTQTEINNTHIIMIPSGGVTVNNQPISPGDYIGVFYSASGGLACGGYSQWIPGNNAVTAWGDDMYSPEKDGFYVGDPFYWKVWLTTPGIAVDMTATYQTGPNFNSQGFFNVYGTSGIDEMTGTYTLAQTFTLSAYVDQPVALSLNISGTGITCFGAATGAVYLVVNGGISPYSFSWSNDAITQDLLNVAAGTYSVTVTDSNNCISTATITLTQLSEMNLSLSKTDVTTYGGNDGSVDLTVTGGSYPYACSWSNGAITEDLSFIPAGTYIVEVTDSQGCTATAQVNISQPSAPPLSITYSSSDPNCFGNCYGSITLFVSGGTSPYYFQWSNNASTQNLDNLCAGIYEVTVTDANNCSASSSFVITEPDLLEVQVSSSPVLCTGGTSWVVVTATGGTPPYSGIFSNYFPAGIYSFTVYDVYQCSSIIEITITEPEPLDVNALFTPVQCYGGTSEVTITATGGTAPYFGTGIFTRVSGWHSFTIIDDNGCTASVDVFIPGPFPLLVYADAGIIQCNGGNTQVNVWATGGTEPYTGTGIFTAGSGWQTYVVIDDHGCQSSTGINITEPEAILFSYIKGDETISGNSDGWINLNITGGIVPYTFLWSTGAVTQNITNIPAGDYQVTVTDYNGCNVTASIAVSTLSIFTSQAVSLNYWCLISTFINPVNPSVISVFSGLLQNLHFVKSENGAVYMPMYGINNIGNLIVGKGYQVRMFTPCTLFVSGLSVIPELTPVNIQQGWSFLGYLRQTPANMVTMLSPIVSHIIMVKNETGLVYWPLFNLNAIGNMLPGKGYQIKLSSASNLTYPPNSINNDKAEAINKKPVHFAEPVVTGNNMTLGIPESAWNITPKPGDEIGVFGENGQPAGSCVISNNLAVVTIWGKDVISPETFGLSEGEKYSLKLWINSGDSEILLNGISWLEGDDHYTADGISIIEKIYACTDSKVILYPVTPNPFENYTTIRFYLPEKMTVELTVFNILGEKTNLIAGSCMEAGNHDVVLDAHNLSPGTYFITLYANGIPESGKICLIR
jgi:hypothetical protein